MAYSGDGFVEPAGVTDPDKFLLRLAREIDETAIKSNYMMANGKHIYTFSICLFPAIIAI